MLALLLAGVAVVALLAGVPMRCQGPIARSPFRGCRNTVYGFLGHCRHHGFQPGRRLMAVAGGSRLLQRRTCPRCGEPRAFVRLRTTGKPFLGCSGYPACERRQWLDA